MNGLLGIYRRRGRESGEEEAGKKWGKRERRHGGGRRKGEERERRERRDHLTAHCTKLVANISSITNMDTECMISFWRDKVYICIDAIPSLLHHWSVHYLRGRLR